MIFFPDIIKGDNWQLSFLNKLRKLRKDSCSKQKKQGTFRGFKLNPSPIYVQGAWKMERTQRSERKIVKVTLKEGIQEVDSFTKGLIFFFDQSSDLTYPSF